MTQPQIIQGIHEAYLDAGADIIETNSFNGTRVSMSDYHMEDLVPEINREAARLAKAACEKYSTPENHVLLLVYLDRHRVLVQFHRM